MVDGDDLDIHLQKIHPIYQDLKIAGDNLLESEFLITLVCSLPTSWDTFIGSIKFNEVKSEDDKIKQAAIDSILACLHGEGTCRKSLAPTPSSSAFNSHGSNSMLNEKSNKSDKPDKSKSECNYCHKKGHWIRECQKHKSDEKKKNTNVATQKGDDLKRAFCSSTLQLGNAWIGDSAADHHVIHDHNSFTEYHPLLGQFLMGVGGIKAPIHGSGTVPVTMHSCSSSHSVKLRDCYHIPSTDGNLLSLHCFDKSGGEIQIKSGKVVLVAADGTELCQGKAQGDSLYMMDMRADNVLAAMAGTTRGDSDGHTWEDWHKAMGHISPWTLKLMQDSSMVEGMKVIESLLDFDCEACIQGKQTVQPLPKELTTEYSKLGNSLFPISGDQP